MHRREWEPADADGAEFLWLRVEEPNLGMFSENDDPRSMCADVNDLPRRRSCLVGTYNTGVLLPSSVEDRLAKADFAHLRLRPIKIKRQVGDKFVAVESEQRWSQLLSDLVLPPFAPSIQKRKLNGGPIVERLYSGCVGCTEPPFRDFQPAYLRSEWKRVPEFDVATTYEHKAEPADLFRWLIVSRRFYEFCQAHKLKAGWVPVRFEEG